MIRALVFESDQRAFAPTKGKIMIRSHAFQSGIFEPDELGLLNRVLEKTCRWHGLSGKGEDAALIAARAITLFRSGLFDEAALFKTLRREPLPKVPNHRRDVSDLFWRKRIIPIRA